MRPIFCAGLILLLVLAGPALSQDRPDRDPPPGEFEPRVIEPLEPPPRPAPPRGGVPGAIASEPVNVAILVVGLAGWVALGLSVLYLERNGNRHA